MVQTTRITLRDRIQSIEDAISAGQIDAAMTHCQHILARYPDALEIQRLLGEVYLAQGHLEEAQQSFDWILVNDPENVIVYCDRALICENQSDIDTALDCYQQAYELSRGNSQIRHEFNMLSAKAGQQEFMLSRAGLARLYMRGNLLTQAIQEWEAVLTANHDRMDARLGLLETYWREGHYDEVERMASSILEEVPHCLKALLLLAHVTSAYNLHRAKDLVARAEKLDPELLIAQDLFNDLASSQPNDPFLALVRKEPISLLDEEMNGKEKAIDTISTSQYVAVEIEPESTGEETNPDRVYNWNGKDSWSELDTRSVPQTNAERDSASGKLFSQKRNGGTADAHVPEEIAWSDDSNIKQVEAWATDGTAGQSDATGDYEAWATQQEIDDDFDPALLEQQPWFKAEQASSENMAEFSVPDPEAAASSTPWHSAPQRETLSTPPAWLDMLTQSGRPQPVEPISPMPPVASASSPTRRHEEAQDTFVPQTYEATPEDPFSSYFMPSGEKEEEDMGWPEWLKSLGAESIEPESMSAPETFVLPDSESQPDEQFVQETWASPELSLQEAEAHYVTTLEALEQSLLSQGFAPLQPGSLSTIAQHAQTQEEAAPVESMPVTAVQVAQEMSTAPVEQPPVNLETIPVAEEIQPEAILDESPFTRVPTAPLPVETSEQIQDTRPIEEAEQPAAELEAVAPASESTPPLVIAPAAPLDLDALLDSELEITMRRPAVRLQPIHAVAKQGEQPQAAGKSRPLDLGTQATDSVLSNKERLLKGYQFQLAGAYDDAMQEYRLLIRNAPEFLGDVISNVRALLKLAPKFTAGYRVLGDAYMRQGEYLQAMESYNKALTIAKKTKGQTR